MLSKRERIVIIALCAATGLAGDRAAGALGQAMGNVRTRGMVVLKPAPTPTPTPTDSPAPSPAVSTPSGGLAPTPALALKSCARPFARPDLMLGADTASFDRHLKTKLRATHGPVVVDIVTPFPPGTPPAVLQPWLAEVKRTGGAVRPIYYCQASRGLFGSLRGLFAGTDRTIYQAVDGRDAVLHVDGLDQVVTQVEFAPRKGK